MKRGFTLLLGLAACGDDPATSPAAKPTTCVDVDQDGSCTEQDCDDTDPDIHPGAAEIWYDGIDQACNAGDDQDADFDGFPIGPPELDARGIPLAPADCDDTDPQVHPAIVAMCGNGIDDDCDGRDECALRGEVLLQDVSPIRVDGGWLIGTHDLDADGRPDWIVQSATSAGKALFAAPTPWDEPILLGTMMTSAAITGFGEIGGSTSWSDVVEPIFTGLTIHLDVVGPSPVSFTLPLQSGDFGAIAFADLTGDGSGDMALSGQGQVDVVGGPLVAGGGESLVATLQVTSGIGLIDAADLTGDGQPDLAAPSADGVVLFPGPTSGVVDAADHLAVTDENVSGYVLFTADWDWNQDGHLDLLYDEYDRLTTFFGPFEQLRDAQSPDAVITDISRGVNYPGVPTPCGDLNGDTFPDLCTRNFGVGATTGVFYGPFVGAFPDWLGPDLVIVPPMGTLPGNVAPAGDLDGDGADEFVLDVQDDGGFGSVHLIQGAVGFGF